MAGQTPVIESTGSWKNLTMTGLMMFTAKGNNPKLFFTLKPGSMRKEDFVIFLKDIKKELKGKKLLLIWDGLSGHKAKIVTEYITSQSKWLRVERYPEYAPELNPVEYLWSLMKNKDLAQVPPKGLRHLRGMVRKSVRRIRKSASLLKGFMKKAGLLS